MSFPDMSSLFRAKDLLREAKSSIMQEWVEEEQCVSILARHRIDTDLFVTRYAEKVFDYFISVVSGEITDSDCPVIADLIDYLKDKELGADELFLLCAHFKYSVINATYRLGINDQSVFTAVSYMFDRNFAAVLRLYTDTIYEKEQEAINASKAKEYFLSKMSHEIRTPLNAILGFVSLLQDETTNPRYQKYLKIISSSGENLLQIINDILDFSKIRSGEFAIDPQPFNIHDELSHTMELFVPSANSKSITLTSFIDPDIPYEMSADALRINQIVGNFLSNAIKFTDNGSAIHVEATHKDQMLILSVSDQGRGIDPADQERIFDAFSQAYDGMMKFQGGTGLGLAICKQLAEHMGGTIELKSAPGEGSTFTLKVPVAVDPGCEISKFDVSIFEGIQFGLLRYDPSESYKLESLRRYWDHFGLDVDEVDSLDGEYDLLIFLESSMDDAKREQIITRHIPSIAILDFLDDRYDAVANIVPLTFPIYCTKLQAALNEVLGRSVPKHPSEEVEGGRIGFRGKALVAEDNDANQELIKIILGRYGLEYVIASDGLEALEKFRSEPFDIILMDEQMPQMNGNIATAAILAHEQETGREHTPVVALTANVIKGARERSIQNGYDAFLGKPIVLKEMEQVFRRYLETVIIPDDVSAESDPSNQMRINMEHLKSALMLDEEQIVYLLQVYQEKMTRTLRELKEAIVKQDFESIAKVAHSIKGSSANFRFDELSRLASVIEDSAGNKETDFDFEEAYSVLSADFAKRFE